MDTDTDYVTDTDRYAKCIAVSRRIRWDIDDDVIRGRSFDFSEKFLPDTISGIDRLGFLDQDERRFLSQVQGRTYANMFGLVERFICAKVLEVSRDHWLGDQVALESLVRFSDEELKHQALFRRIESMIDNRMPDGYRFLSDPNEFSRVILRKCTWAVLAMICQIEFFTQAHYRESIAPDDNVSPLFKDIFLYHWREESQHAIMDELEWRREDHKLTGEQRDLAVDDLIELIDATDRVLRAQMEADVGYFLAICHRAFSSAHVEDLRNTVLAAYRWQYIASGVQHPRFSSILSGMIDAQQAQRLQAALDRVLNT